MYHIVAADSRAARAGKFLEIIGRYEPLLNPMLIEAKEDSVFRWLKNGARPTDTVRSLFQRNGLWKKWTMTKDGLDEAKIAAEMEKWQMVQAEKAQRDEVRKARRQATRRKVKKSPEAEPASVAAPAEEAAPAQAS